MKFKYYIISLLFITALSSCKTSKKITDNEGTKTPVEVKALKRTDNVSSLFIDANKEKILGNYKQAIDLFQQCLSKDPAHDASMYELARLYQMQGNIHDAKALAEKAAEIDTENKWYNMLLASLYEQTGEIKKAILIFDKLQNLYPKEIEFLYHAAMLYIRDGKPDKAIDIYDKIERINGPEEEIIIQKHRLYLLNGQVDKAVAEIERLIKTNPDETRYYAMLSELYLSLDNFPKAIENLEKIKELDPENPYIHITLAEYYFRIDDINMAIQELKQGFAAPNLEIEIKLQVLFNYFSDEDFEGEYYDQVLELSNILAASHPADIRPYSLLTDLYLRKSKYQEASDVLRKAIKIDNSNFMMWETLLRLEVSLSDTLNLKNDAVAAIELFPLHPLPYFFSGIACYMLEDYQQAIKKLESGIDLVVDDDKLLGDFYSYLGDIYNKTKQYNKSDYSFDQALNADPDNPYILNNYSYYLSQRKIRLDDAEKMSSKSIELTPDSPHYLDTYGWIMYQMGKYEEAKKWIEKSMENSETESSAVLEHYGDVLYKLGKTEEAIIYWKKALELADEISDFLREKVKDGILYE